MQNNPWEPMLDETNKHYFEHKLRGRKLTPETEIRYREYILSGTIGEVYAGFINEIDSLRNVIESQKEEIASHGPEGRNYTNQQYVDLLQKFESQKEEIEKMWDLLRDASFIIDPQHTGILKRISEVYPRKEISK